MAACSVTLPATASRLTNATAGSSSFTGTSLSRSQALSLSLPRSSPRSACRVEASADWASLCGERDSLISKASRAAAALGLAAVLQGGAGGGAAASEYNILSAAPPLESHVVDDAGVLSRLAKADLRRLLADLEDRTGYHIDVVTLRKITTKGDVFELADRVIETWYPTLEEGNKRAVLLLVTTAKEGALAGGPAFNEAVGDDLLEAIVAENLPVLATEERYNEALLSAAKRLVARIDGKDDIAGPRFDENKRISNYKTKEETESKRGQFTFVVGGLLAIAFVVPMAQYYAYVSKK